VDLKPKIISWIRGKSARPCRD